MINYEWARNALLEQTAPVHLPSRDVAAAADAPSCRLRPAELWPGRRTSRNRGGRVEEADALLSSAGPGGGSLGALYPRGLCAIRCARALGAGGDASGIGG